MAEPEDVLLDAAHKATLFVRGLWARRSAEAASARVLLRDVRPRLELFVGAAYRRPFAIRAAEAPAVPTWLGRLAHRTPRHLVRREALPATDGERLFLPRALDEAPDASAALDRYRVFAVEQAARAARGTPRHLPPEKDPLVRDLYALCEAAAVDRSIADELPGLLPLLRAARAAEHAHRPATDRLTPPELAVERLLLELLASPPPDPPLSLAATPELSLRWARETADAVRAGGGRYRGLPPVTLWGEVLPPTARPAQVAFAPDEGDGTPRPPARVGAMPRRPQVREAPEDEDDERVGMWMIQLDDPQEHVEDPMGLRRPTDRDDATDPDDLADSLSELPEARLVATPGSPREVLKSEDPPETARAHRQEHERRPAGVVYPEWDYHLSAYHDHGAVVREVPAALGDAAWAEGVRARRAALRHEVQRRFERLRPRRLRLGRQPDGEEIDLEAYVTTFADRRAGQAGDDRLYVTSRPARRDLAITLLVDVSASTDAWVTENLRIVDVEKEALLVVCDALDALGDPYAILAFSGEGPDEVAVTPLKGFSERNGPEVARRIAALEPDRYTRAGAALRHATALLMQRPARHRLLLVLSDGKPNDVDRYEGLYGVEDVRQAVAEARLQGIHTFCLTVDRHAPEYMPRLFDTAFAVLPHPERLPVVLVDVLRRLIRA